MAIFKSSLVSDIRGSIGGSTFSRTRSGAIIRNRTVPINPNTTFQAQVRADLNNAAYQWSILDRGTIESWDEIAKSYPVINKLGDSYIQSGKQFFVSCMLNLRSIGVLTNPVLPSAVPEIPDCDITAVTITATRVLLILSVLEVDMVTSTDPAAVIIYKMSPNFNPTRGANTNRNRVIGYQVTGSAFDAGALWRDRFGSPAVSNGQIVNMQVAAVSPATGLSSAYFTLRGLIASV